MSEFEPKFYFDDFLGDPELPPTEYTAENVGGIVATYPQCHFAVIAIPIPKNDIYTERSANDVRKAAGSIHKYLNKDKAKLEKVALAQTKVDEAQKAYEAVALLGDISRLEEAAGLAKIWLDAKEELEKVKNGKTRSNGSGDRSNPLPAFESTNAVMRGKNGDKVLAIRGDAIPDFEEKGLSANWQAFQPDGDGKYTWKGTLGDHESWSSLNQKISSDVIGLEGKSIGTNGLAELSPENLETIRTTMLTGFGE